MEALIKFEQMVCCRCHVRFAVDVDIYNRLKESGEDFYCPAGHAQRFLNSPVEKLRAEFDARAAEFQQEVDAAVKRSNELTNRVRELLDWKAKYLLSRDEIHVLKDLHQGIVRSQTPCPVCGGTRWLVMSATKDLVGPCTLGAIIDRGEPVKALDLCLQCGTVVS